MSRLAKYFAEPQFQEPPLGLSRTSLQLRVIQNRIGEEYFAPISRQNNLYLNFLKFVRIWKKETRSLSSIIDICMHPAYQRIIGMGHSAVPLILKELQREEDHWFWALKAITGENPIQPQNRGDIERMTEDWLRWGRENGKV